MDNGFPELHCPVLSSVRYCFVGFFLAVEFEDWVKKTSHNKGFNRIPVSSAAAKPGKSGGGAG